MSTDSVNIRDFDIVFFDCEFTGLELKHEIVEIGWVKARAKTFERMSEGSIKIMPLRLHLANPESLAISGYNEQDWLGSRSLPDALKEFSRETAGTMLAGHNVAIDLAFLKKSLEECGMQPNYFYKSLDTFNMAWAKLHDKPEFNKFSLSELAPYFGVDMGMHHRALDDARTTYEVFKKLMVL